MVFSNTLSTHKNVTVTISTDLHTRLTFQGEKEIFRGFGFPHNKQKEDELLPPYPQHLCPILPWQHLPWPKIMGPQLPMSLLTAPVGGFAIGAAGPFA
jgi:hypothetical protein